MSENFCVNCEYYSKEKPKKVAQTRQDSLFNSWCSKLNQGTAWNLLRCGGDDFKKKEPK